MIRHGKLRPVCERETNLYSLTQINAARVALDVIMEDYGGFQTQFTSLMENVLKAAVGEATKLFERTLQQLKAELVHLRQENVDLKTGLFPRQFKTRHATEGSQRTDHDPGPPKCDIGVQCEKPLMVERCCSPAQFGEHPLHLRDITSECLADLCSSASEDENRQLALLLIKKEPQETNCDDYAPGYFLLKQEGAEPILVRKEPFRKTMERVMIPSTFQTVTRCCGNPRELVTASTANAVSSNQDTSNNKITQTTSSSSYKGSTSDKETPRISASAKKSTLPGLSNSSQSSTATVSLAAPEVSLFCKPGQLSMDRVHPTVPTVSLQTNQLCETHTPMLKTSQAPQTVQNIQNPTQVANFSTQQVQRHLAQQNPVTTRSSVQSLPAPPAPINKRILPPIDHSVISLSRSSQAIKPSVPPLESVLPQVPKMTVLGRFGGPRAPPPFFPDKCTIAPGPVSISQSQITPLANHVMNPPVQGPVAAIQSSVLPVQGPVAAIKSSVLPVQGSVAAVQSSVIPVQGRVPSVQGLVPPIQGPVQPVQNRLKSVRSLVSPIQGPVPHVQSPVPPVQSSVPPIQNPALLVQGSVPHIQSPVPPVQVSVPPVRGPVRPIHVPPPPAHSPVLQTQGPAQSNEVLAPHSQSLNLQAHFPSVPHHNLTPSTQASYPPTHIPFAQSYIPVQSMKSNVSSVSIPQTNAPSPQEQMPVTSLYQILPDNLCSSSDQFFPPPDDSSDLLQPLPPMPLHSAIVLTQQQAALEQPSMIHSQSSRQPLQLAPLLTLKEQQAANQGNLSKIGSTVHVEIPMSTVNNFEEHAQRFPHCSSSTLSCGESDSTTMDMHNEDSTENDDHSCPGLMPGMREHYTFLSKPQSDFRVLESSTEPQTFIINTSKGPQIESEVSKQSQSDCVPIGALARPSLSAPAPNRNRILQKASRRALEKNTECSECGRILSNASSLENHMRLHRGERPYNCSQCGKAFPSVRGLNRHVKVHAEEKGYKCEDCGRSFVYQFTLTKHKLIHSGDRPFPCKICGKKFLSKADRSTHMRMHTGEKPFFCNQCGKTFKHRVALNMHVQGHRGEKRYVCPHCDKGFVDLGNFKRHKRIHTGEKPFECKECSKRFTQSAHLKKHINTQHAVSKAK